MNKTFKSKFFQIATMNSRYLEHNTPLKIPLLRKKHSKQAKHQPSTQTTLPKFKKIFKTKPLCYQLHEKMYETNPLGYQLHLKVRMVLLIVF